MSDIKNWLAELGLGKYVSAFAEAEIELTDLIHLTDDDLKELGLPMGPRRRAIDAIGRVNAGSESHTSEPEVTAPKQSDPDRISPTSSSDAERRHLTVMFVDLVGSTEMSTRLDVEDMRDVITSYQNTVAGVVSRYEGFVAKFMGDGVLCYFGWPRANEDDAERAVRAGLSIIEAVGKTNAPDAAALATRVGIATGVVIVGDLIGSGATQEAAVVGDTPNLAARLQGIAGINQIVIPSGTQRLLGGAFTLKSIGAHALKGIGAPIEAFVVEGETVVESRFAARQSGTLTPIVGRDREIELILERWAMARLRQGQVALVTGEAGIGKSRITKAVIDEVAREDHIRMTYQCSPYHVDSAFYPVIQQMSFAAGFQPVDSPDARLDKLETLLGADQETLKLVAPIMGLDGTERYGVLDLTPAQQRAQTMKTLAGLLVRQAAEKPVLMVFEDLHWIDPTSLELLDILLDAIADQPIMILATARPTFEHGFSGHPIVTRFALNRLGKDQIGAIVSKLTEGKALPDEIMEIIAGRTDGVPLFVEELTKTILESGALKEAGERYVLDGPLSAIAIPATLHDSLMARLDRLQPIKEVAQTAACIGREFSHGLLAQISPLSDAELSTALDGLITAELIYRRGLPPEATYLFKHALVRDAAYESLLKEKRRAVHTRILSALETDTDIAPEVLAVHAEAANLTDRAIDLWEVASKAAIARPAFDEAISHLGRAIALITPQLENSDTPPFERALALQVPLSMTLLTRKGYTADETLEALEKALIIADKVGETPMRYPILYGLWIGAAVRGQYADALRTAEAFVEETAKSPKTPSTVVANRVAGTSHFLMGNFAEAQRYLDVALANYDPIAHAGLASQIGLDVGVTVHSFQAFNLLMLGQTRRAATHIEEAESLAMSTGHIETICPMLMQRAIWYSLLSGDRSDAERCWNKIVPIAQEHNLTNLMNMTSILAEVLAAHKGDKSSIARYRKVDAAVIAAKYKMGIAQFRVDVARSALAMGLREEAAELAMMAQELIDETGETHALSDLHRLQAAIAIAGDDTETAEKYLVTALDVARRQGSKLWELRAAIDLAGLWRDQGRNAEAISLLEPVHDSIAEGDCPEDMEAARELLAV
jgi:class 3 adenylate cyclase/tetratricopeptide (TPR) repeat protein/ABC-type transport system involved in cytochrome c biogenesis ATPase subunit